MAIQDIDLGTVIENGEDGDVARTAFTKVNENFDDLDARVTYIESLDIGTVTSVNDILPVNGNVDLTPADIGAATAAQGAKADTAVQVDVFATALNQKVDKVEGYQLSQEDYTTDEKNKLASLESSLFLGVYSSLAELEAAHPSSDRPGEYAFIPAGGNIYMFVWDTDTERWVTIGSGSEAITAEQVKTLYESNPDTNAFTNAEKTKLSGIETGAQVNVATNISQGTRTDTTVGINSSTGTGAIITGASSTQAGVMIATDKVKLDSTEVFTQSAKNKLDSIPAFPPNDGKSYLFKDGQWVEFTGGVGGEPLLAIQWYDGRRDRLSVERPGWVPRDGQLLERAVWPEAWAAIRDSYAPVTDAVWLAGEKGRYSVGDGSTTFRVPDINGATGGKSRTLRGTSAAQGGSLQEDAFQGHSHRYTVSSGGRGTQSTSGNVDVISVSPPATVLDDRVTVAISDGTNGTPRVADETRMANVQGAWIVKLAHKESNVGTVDVMALASEQVAQGARITSLEGKQPTRLSYSGAASPIALGAIPVDATKVTIIFSEITYTASTNLMLEMDDGAGNWLGGGTSGTLTRWTASGTAGVSWTTAMNMMNSGITAGSYTGKIVLEKNMQNEWVATMSFGGKTAVFNLASNGILPGSQVAARNMRIVSSGALSLTATVKVEK